ncbi:MAG: putative dehydrogenase [Limisphaerales bacterium]|jgi:predicted dehydrogenase
MKSLSILLTSLLVAGSLNAAELKLGLIGLDTSHVIAFTKVLNDKNNKSHVPGAKVVAAFKGGSKDIASSFERIDGFTKTLNETYGVKIYSSIPEMCKHVDAVLLESVDGRPHWKQARPVIMAGKPLFIDKPMAGSLADAIRIFELAKKQNVPVFSSSSLRYGKATQEVRGGSLGRLHYVQTGSPASLEKSHPDLFWYGVHGCESLFTAMGTGCLKVQRSETADGKIEVTGYWEGNRFGVFRERKGYGGIAIGEKGSNESVGKYDGYAPLVAEIVKFFQTGKPPVDSAETLELFAFMEAADESKRRGGEWVEISEVMKKAKTRKKK